MDGRLSQQTHGNVAYGNRNLSGSEEAYTPSRMQVAQIPEGSSCKESLTQANQSSLAILYFQNAVPDSQPL